jgi:hypothetical protein
VRRPTNQTDVPTAEPCGFVSAWEKDLPLFIVEIYVPDEIVEDPEVP